MQVIDYQPESWTLLKDRKTVYLEISIPLENVKFSSLIKLSKNELHRYEELGRNWIGLAARQVQRTPYCYYSRNESISVQKEVGDAILEWKKTGAHLLEKTKVTK